MSRLPDWLDPATLRWLADQEMDSVEWWDSVAADCTGVEDLRAKAIATQQAYVHKCKAKRLRNIATRVEQRRER